MFRRRVHGDAKATLSRLNSESRSDDHDVASITEPPVTVVHLPPPVSTTGLNVIKEDREGQEDTAVQASDSALSEDSHPPRILNHTPLITPADEEHFFETLYEVVKQGFSIWKENHKGKV